MPVLLLFLFTVLVVYGFIRFWSSSQGAEKVLGTILIVAGLLLISPCMCIFTRFFVMSAYQEASLDGFARRFHRLEHPPGTVLIESHQGRPYFGENECAYFVGELREYSGERQDVIEFYVNQERKNPFSDNMYVLFLEDGEFTESIPVWEGASPWRNEAVWAAEGTISSSYPSPDDWGLSPSTLEGKLYVVYFAYIGGYLDYKSF